MKLTRDNQQDKAYWESFIDALAIPVLILNTEGVVLYANRSALEYLKTSTEQLIGHSFFYPVRRGLKKEVEIFFTDQAPKVAEINSESCSWLSQKAWAVTLHDITERKQYENKLQELAYHDSLTNLPNRNLLEKRLEEVIKHARHSHQQLGVIFIDIDNFKSVNDTAGHQAGDAYLQQFVARLNQLLLPSDILARHGGDEFVLVATNIHAHQNINALIKKIYSSLKAPIFAQNKPFLLTVSIGATYYPQSQPISGEQLIRQADQMMYQSKNSGKGCATIFNETSSQDEQKKNLKLSQLRQAFKQHELVLYYQPKVNMQTHQVFGVEALLRWKHPTRGLLLPKQFLPQILHHEFISELTHWIIKTALDQLSEWDNLYPNLSISVNIDAYQLEQPDFLNTIKMLLKQYPQNIGRRLEFEILESSLILRPNKVNKIIKKCKSLGIEFSLDDFGTGFSSINYLLKYPFQYMKIDTRFIKGIIESEKDRRILQAILDIANIAHIKVIAEGVETEAHSNMLLGLGCKLGQGFAFSRAISPQQFERWYTRWHAK